MSVADRVKFERTSTEFDAHCLCAKEALADFWLQFGGDVPSLAALDSLGQSLHNSVTGAARAFDRMMALNPQSYSTRNRYASFLSDVRVVDARSTR
jgi:hypothetical protein